MFKKISICCVIFVVYNFGYVYAADRVVLKSETSGYWYEKVYLIADKLSWMDYENFTVQIGDMGLLSYNFPDWYHGKYEPALYKEDISGDNLKDVIVVLNNDKAGPGKPHKDIHILNQVLDPYRRYGETPIEPIALTIDQNIRLEQQGSTVTIFAEKKKYKLDISKYNYKNPHAPYVSLWSTEYSIRNSRLLATSGVYVIVDDAVTPFPIGHIEMEYFFDGRMYKVKTMEFKQFVP